MPSPSSKLATQRPDLAESFMEFDLEMDARGFISQEIFPVVEVQSQAGNFGRIPLDQLLQKRETRRAPGSGYNRSNFTFKPDVYATQRNGAEEPVDDMEREMYADYFDAELVATARAYSVVQRGAEERTAAKVFDAATWTGADFTSAVTNEWNDLVNATPIEDVENAVQKIYDNSGLWANALVINRKVFRYLRNCEQIIDRIASQGAGTPAKSSDITEQMLSLVFDLTVKVAGSSQNAASEGQAADVQQIWSDEYAMVCKVATTGDVREPCIGRTFHWSKAGSQIGGAIESYREEQTESDIIRVKHDTDEKRLYKEAGFLLSNITDPTL